MEITKDNAFDLGKNRTGWFIGHFMDNPNFKTEDFEIQFIDLKKGFSKESTKINPNVKAVTILIKGNFELDFPEENKKVVLKEQGDFVKFDLSSKHIGKAIKDTRILTIKWPSVK
tara:strand:- start:104 stop:448 length:345 start_codon:yes stop_codon:yes gene_type:complete